MKTRKRTEITIETSRIVVITRQASITAWCAGCRQRVQMVSVDAAARRARVSARTIFRWAEAEAVHFKETPEGLLLICLNSLPPPTITP